jgi:hypothetical protein
MNRTVLCSALLAAAALSAPSGVRAETVNCTPVNSLPATLTSQGVYCLKKDLTTAMSSGNAITFAANNITLDCNGYKVGGLAAGIGTETVGLYASGRMNLVVRNCNIRGFRNGIGLYDGSGHLVEDNRLDGITGVGMWLGGDGTRIRDNALFDTGGTTTWYPVAGIQTWGDVEIVGNSIRGVFAETGAIYAISAGYGDSMLVADNRVSGVDSDYAAIGISIESTGGAVVRGNAVYGPLKYGILCDASGGHAIGNQVVGGVTNKLSNCANGGGNYMP